MKKLTAALVAAFTALVLGFGVLLAPAANAGPACTYLGVCGHVKVHKSSAKGCLIYIDGDWSNGSKGYHPTLRNIDGYRDSKKHFKDTDGYKVNDDCKGFLPNGWPVGKGWHKITDDKIYTIQLRKR